MVTHTHPHTNTHKTEMSCQMVRRAVYPSILAYMMQYIYEANVDEYIKEISILKKENPNSNYYKWFCALAVFDIEKRECHHLSRTIAI